ncbi:MAG TPA: protein phosphatase CheZ [Arenibaculum sp.]|nr:protein phosphatase CheZ [Arenibaculum sp.]
MERPVQLTDEEFEHVEETIARSAKGRAFLRRFAHRMQGAAAAEVRDVLDRMRDVLAIHEEAATTSQHVAVLRRELLEMAGSIEQARREVAALRPPEHDNNRILTATNELDAIVTSTERASFDILNSAERLMEFGTRLRRSGADEQLCADIETEVTNIFTACSFQDLTGQRTSKVVNALRYIEQRINAMIQIWGIDGVNPVPEMPSGQAESRPDAHLLSGPSLPGQGVSQSDVDALFGAAAPAPEPAPEPVPEPPAPRPEPPPPKPPAPPAASPPSPPEPSASGPTKQPLDQSAIDALFG